MKTRILIIVAFVGLLSLFAFIPHSDASRMIVSLEEMAQRSDAIIIGTIQNTWIDVRPFDQHPIVDTAKIKVDDWLKNNKNSDTLEIRYYGYWAKTIDDLRGVSISGTPVFHYESGQKVLVILDHEDETAVMGGGYYPFFEGSFVINDNVATSQTGEQTTLNQLNSPINHVLNNDDEQLDCFLTEYWDGTKCVPVDFDVNVESWTTEYGKSEKLWQPSTRNSLVYYSDNFYCIPSDDGVLTQCSSLEEIVFGNARKDWTVYPGGSGYVPPENSKLTRIYKEVDVGVPPLNFTAMLDDKIFVEKCESNGGMWNYTRHDCEGLWEVCRDIGGITIQEDITPPCIDTGIIDDDPLTVKVCRGAGIIRASCVFEYEN
ncbi:hypothetical protein [Nitrosopumilus piranensis]|uniref:Uncharacterized protein n=1 Tax=Nitrosopumilus piranensis TaxID=1582439 RepID=A0A0C5BXR1_9ARCH|nr:hypothetical protein [Nitrosopumilus piranensis]AJM93086.1 exported protein of unknown function [Nitrosopumilus piranensis]